jgi:hypothetical protein
VNIPGKKKVTTLVEDKLIRPMQELWSVVLCALALACTALIVALSR